MLAISVLTLVLTSEGVQRGVMLKKANKNTSLDTLNLDEGSIPFTRSNNFLSIFADSPVTVVQARPAASF